jgi:hypothetical protein
MATASRSAYGGPIASATPGGTRVLEVGVTRLRRGEGDDEGVVVAVLRPSGLEVCPRPRRAGALAGVAVVSSQEHRLDQSGDLLPNGLTREPGWPTLRGHLLLLARAGADPVAELFTALPCDPSSINRCGDRESSHHG